MPVTPFQDYAHSRWLVDFPQWNSLRETLPNDGDDEAIHIRYVVPSPSNKDNVLCVLFTPHDVTVMFAAPETHEHFDPDLFLDCDSQQEAWRCAYDSAIEEFIKPVLLNQLKAVWFEDNQRCVLTNDIRSFVDSNRIVGYRCESWDR